MAIYVERGVPPGGAPVVTCALMANGRIPMRAKNDMRMVVFIAPPQ